MKQFFLSASVPDPTMDVRYIDTADVTAIREAVIALAAAVFRRGRLVFGGHPAISPLVLLVARNLGVEAKVRIYQSEYFRARIPPESAGFPDLVWTPAQHEDRSASLAIMRERMVGEGPFEAAVFIGGMEGVEDEFELFRSRWPRTAAFPIATTGAAAKILLARHSQSLPGVTEQRRGELERDSVYGALFSRLFGE
jgi:hypothetical protein